MKSDVYNERKLIVAIAILVMAVIITASLAWFATTAEADAPKINASVPCFGDYFDGGAGVAGDPYEIRTAEQLKNLAWLQYLGYFNRDYTLNDGKSEATTFYFELTTDIDMSGYTLPPIGTTKYPFIGNFNGNSYTVSNLTVSNSAEIKDGDENAIYKNAPTVVSSVSNVNAVGFFGVVGGISTATGIFDADKNEVKDLKLSGITIDVKTTTALAGVAVGYLNGKMSNVVVDDAVASSIKTSQATGAYNSSYTSKLSDYYVVGYATKDYSQTGVDTEVEIDRPIFETTKAEDGWDTSSTGTSWGNSIAMNSLYTRINAYYTNGITGTDGTTYGKASQFQYLTGMSYIYDTDGTTLLRTEGGTYVTPDSDEPTYGLMHLKTDGVLRTSAAITKHSTSFREWITDLFGYPASNAYYLYGKNTISSDNVTNYKKTKVADGDFYIWYKWIKETTYAKDGTTINLQKGNKYWVQKKASSTGQMENGRVRKDEATWHFSDPENKKGTISTSYGTNGESYLYVYKDGSNLRLYNTAEQSSATQWWEDSNGVLYTKYNNEDYYIYIDDGSAKNNWKVRKANSTQIRITDGNGHYLTSEYKNNGYNFKSTTDISSAATITVEEKENNMVMLKLPDNNYLEVYRGDIDKDDGDDYDSYKSCYLWEYDGEHYINHYNDNNYYLYYDSDNDRWTISTSLSEEFRMYTMYNGNKVYMKRNVNSSTSAHPDYSDELLGVDGSDRSEACYWEWDDDMIHCKAGYYLTWYSNDVYLGWTSSSSADDWIHNADGTLVSDDSKKYYVKYTGTNWVRTTNASEASNIVFEVDNSKYNSKREYIIDDAGKAEHLNSEGYITTTLNNTYETPDTCIPLIVNSSKPSPAASNPGYLVGGAQGDQDDDDVINSADVLVTANCYAYNNLTYSNGGSTKYNSDGSNLEILTRNQNTGGEFVRIKDSFNTNFKNSYLSGYEQKTVTEIGLNRYDNSRESLHNTLKNGDKNSSGSAYINGIYFKNCKAGIGKDCAGVATLEHANILDVEYKDYELLRDSLDVKVKENGYINLFMSSFIGGTERFFSFYKIERDNKNRISAVKEIEAIYNVPKTDSTGEYLVYKYAGASGYVKADGTSVSLPSTAKLAFSKEWLDGSDIENDTGILGGRKDGALYYFEMPVDQGEYAIGGSGEGTSAMIMYLDIGANPIDLSNRTETNKVVEADYSYPKGVYLGSGTSVSEADALVSVSTTDSTSSVTTSAVKTGTTVKVTSGNTVKARYIKSGITLKDGSDKLLKLDSKEVITRTITSSSENVETKTYTDSVLTITQEDGVAPTTASLVIKQGTYTENADGTRNKTQTSATKPETIEYDVDSADGKLSIADKIIGYTYRSIGDVENTITFKSDKRYDVTLEPASGVEKLNINRLSESFTDSKINGIKMVIGDMSLN